MVVCRDMRLQLYSLLVLYVVDFASPLVNNSQIEARNDILAEDTRRNILKKGKEKSTSSSDNEKESDSSRDSLDMSDSVSSSVSKTKHNRIPQSSLERRGWRKWHRKCTPCPEEMRKKWRDPSIKWICGGYQSARRSFKSLCMMHYRNCQDGTMFTKTHDHRCANSTSKLERGDHFFYEYTVHLSDDETNSKSDTESSSVDSDFHSM